MQNNRLLTLLRTFNKAEWRSFRKYLRSPFFNQRTDVTALAGYVERELARPAVQQAFTKAVVWSKIGAGKPYDEKKLRYTFSYLQELAEQFLALREWQADRPAHHRSVFQALHKRGLEKHAETRLPGDEPAGQRASQRPSREAHGGRTTAQLTENARQFTLDLLIETLREGCAFLEIPLAPGEHRPAFPWLSATLKFIESERYTENSMRTALLYETYRMLEKTPAGQGVEHFSRIKKILEEAPDLPFSLRREAWLRALNFAIRQQNLGNKAFGQEAFDLYRSGIGNGLILENGQISKKAYFNTLILALLVGQGAWAETFLRDYRVYLPEHERDNTYRHSLATLYFKQKQFEKVLETLQQVSFTDSLHNLDDRRLLLCSYFELGEWAALDSLLDSFGIWLRRAKQLGYHRELYANLVKFTRRLADTRHLGAPVREKLKGEIAAAKNVAAKEWLLEKVDLNAAH